MLSGAAAASLGVLARDRWRALGAERLPPVGKATRDLWPSALTADLTNVDVAISRTMPGSEEQPAVRECEALFLDSIAVARRAIYIESQYFTNDAIGRALGARLREPDGPEVIIVAPKDVRGLARAEHDGRVSQRRLPRAPRRRHTPAPAARVSRRVSRQGRSHVRSLEGDDR